MTMGLTAPIVGFGAAAKASFDAVDDGADNVIRATGAVGESAEELTGSYKNVAGNIVGSFTDIGSALGEVNTRFGFTGDMLEQSTTDFLKFAEITGMDVTQAVQKVSRYMGDAGIESSNYKQVLDDLAVASQKSGIGVDVLAESLTKYGAPMRALGFDTRESIALFSQWELAGVNTEIAFSGMKKAISNWTAEGKDAKVEFKNLVAGVQDGSVSAQEAMEAFGAKAGPDLIDAIQGGRFAYEDMLAAVEGSEGALDGTFDELIDGSYEADLALQNAQLTLAEAGETLMESLVPAISEGTDALEDLSEWWRNLDDDQQKAILSAAGVVAAAGPMIMMGGKLVTATSSIVGVVGKARTGFEKTTGKLAAMSTGTGAAAKAAGVLDVGLRGATKAAGGLALVGLIEEASKFAYSMTEANKAAVASVDALGSVGDSMTSFGERMANAQSIISDTNAAFTSSGSTIGEVSGTIAEKEAAITGIIATALREQRELREEDLQAIRDYNAQIEQLQSEKVQAYQAGMQGIADSVAAEGQITADRAAELLATTDTYYNDALADLDAYHNSKLQSLNQQFTIEHSMSEEEYAAAIDSENAYYSQSKANLDQSVADTRSAVAQHADATAQLSDDTISTIGEAKEKLNGLARVGVGEFGAYLNSDVKSVEDATRNMSDALATLANDSNSSFLAMQLTMAEGGQQITQDNAQTIDTLLSQFENLPPEIGDAGDKAMRALAEGLDDQLGIDVANSTAQQIIDAYRSKTGDAVAAGEGTGQGYADALSMKKDAAVAAALEVTGMTIEQFDASAAQAGIEGDEAVAAYANQLAAGAQSAQASGSSVAGSATTGLGTGDGSGKGSAIGGAYAAALGGQAGNANVQAALTAGSATSGLGTGNGAIPGSSLGTQFASGVGSGSGVARIKGQSVANSAEGGMRSNAGSSRSWGDHLVQNFASGISGAIDWVRNAASSVADTVARILGHTVPEEGILHEGGEGEVRWGRHLGQNVAAGMRQSLPDIEREADAMADALASIGKSPAIVDFAVSSASLGHVPFGAVDQRAASIAVQVKTNDAAASDAEAIGKLVKAVERLDAGLGRKIAENAPQFPDSRQFARIATKAVRGG